MQAQELHFNSNGSDDGQISHSGADGYGQSQGGGQEEIMVMEEVLLGLM